MSIIVTGVSALLSSRALSSLTYKNLAKKFIKNYFKDNERALFNEKFVMPSNMIEHHITSFDNNELFAYSNEVNSSNSYIIYVFGHDQSYKDLLEISNCFEKNGYNSIFIQNRKKNTFGVKESIDLLTWVDYFKDKYSGSKFILYGERSGAYIVCKALASTMNNYVNKVVLDDLKPTLFDEIINDYCMNNDIKNSLKMAKNINYELNKSMMIDLSEYDLKKSISTNKISVCFVQSKHKNEYEHKELLKIFNATQGEKKIFYTNSLDRNFKQENYFEVILKYIES